MYRQILIGAVVILVLGGTLQAEQPAYKPGVVLVRFSNDPNTSTKNTLLKSVLGGSGSPVKQEYTLVHGLTLVTLPAGVSVDSALASLKQSSAIMYAGPDYISHVFMVPNDTRFSELWGMHNTGQAGGIPGADIDATAAWDISTGNGTTIVAVTDTGVDYNHPDLAANMWTDPNGRHGYDFVNNDSDPMDDYGHGTHVAGTIGAVGNNNLGVAGVCWHIKIMALKVFDANGNGSLSDEISSVQYAVSNGAKVINASWGYDPGVPFSFMQPLYDAVAAARDVNVIFVASAGNSSNNNDASPVYPASFDLDNVISVMATTNTDVKAPYSNYGLTSVDLGAPGGSGSGGTSDILSTLPGGVYGYGAGTSMAAPHVAGACALLLSIDPTLTASQVKQIVLDTVDKTLPAQCVSGGRLNLASAAQEAQQDTIPPTPDMAGWVMPPTATGPHTISMEAQNEIDRSGVEYYFECVDNNSINSGWEPNTLYTFFNKFNPGSTHGFRVKSRDNSVNHNETGWSTTLYATTCNGADTLPPAPSPAQWAIQPKLHRPTPPTIRMQIKGKGTDENGEQFRYKYYDTANPSVVIDSGWLNSADGTFQISSGLVLNHTYVFDCNVKDNLGNATGWSVPDVSVTLTTAPRIIRVPSDFRTIQDAIDNAGNGDTVEVSPYPYPPYYYRGVWARGNGGNINLHFNGKAITVRSTDPENPDVVARTIIDCNAVPDPCSGGVADFNEPNRGFIFDHGEGHDSILAGFTIRNGYVRAFDGKAGDANTGVLDGLPGHTAAGGAILCGPDPDPCQILDYPLKGTLPGSPTIRNCVFENCWAGGGIGGRGADGNDGNDAQAADPCTTPPTPQLPAMPGQNGGWGGYGGAGRGGAIYCGPGCNPVIKNCIIRNCRARPGVAGNGGNGGNGGNDPCVDPGHFAGAGGNAGYPGDINIIGGAGIYAEFGSNPQIIGCTINDCNAVLNVNRATPGLPGLPGVPGNPANGASPGFTAAMRSFGVALGGGLYYDIQNTSVSISSSSFSGNQVRDDMRFDIYDDVHGGGVFLFGDNSGIITMGDCSFSGNSTEGDGGGIGYYGYSQLVLSNCSMMYNYARINGGGLKGWFLTSGILDVYNGNIRNNTAGYGGGLALDSASLLTIQDTQFQDNQAQDGGAIGGTNCSVEIHGSSITGNKAVRTNENLGGGLVGGGFALWNTDGDVTDCVMMNNSADAYGGAAFLEGWTTEPLKFNNCLINDNNAEFEGGGLSVKAGSWAQLNNCTVAHNSVVDPVYGSGGGVSDAEFFAWTEIIDSILWDNSAAHGPQIAVGSLFGSSSDPGGPFADVDVSYSDVQGGKGQVFLENPAYTAVWWMYGSFDADPLFADADANEQTYYLSQMPAGQLVNSPCVDAGDRLAGDLESVVDPTHNTHLTTRTDLVEDIGAVDMGYHYKTGTPNNPVTPGQYQLTIEVYDTGHGGNGRLKATAGGSSAFDINDPNTRLVNQGTEVNLTAIPSPNYKVWYWSGTDNDGSTSLTNSVTMNSAKKVIVAFQPNGMYYLTVTIIGQGTVAIDPNKPLYNLNDVVTLTASPANLSDAVAWTGTDNDYSDSKTNTVTMTGHKNVTVKFYSPRILNVGGDGNYPTIQMAIDDAQDGDIVKITPGTYNIVEASQDQSFLYIVGKDITVTSSRPENPEATSIIGRFILYGVSRRCVIQGLTIGNVIYWAGTLDEPAGVELQELTPQGAGRDGTPGEDTMGAGMWLMLSASPTVRSCIFSNCVARGVHAGNGNGGEDPNNLGTTGNGGPGGRALGGAVYCDPFGNPLFENCSFIGNVARGGDGGNGAAGGQAYIPGHGGAWGVRDAYWWDYPLLDYWKYSGYGGAVYCDEGSTAEFVNCTFSNNTAIGGSCGISGLQWTGIQVPGWPYSHYRIQAFGGAVYASTGSAPTFTGCTFANNTVNAADINHISGGGNVVAAYPTISYGGAVAFENGASPEFTNCSFQQNLATVGGAIWQDESFPVITDSYFIDNSALHGGGVLMSQGVSLIEGCTFNGNEGTLQAAQGGAIALLGANAEITDCNIMNNHSAGSGGGIYLSSKNIDGNEFPGGNSILVKNCLITYNTATMDGGGISSDWHSDPNVVNCTIYHNTTTGLGGGISSSYGSFVNVINSIIWGNLAATGSQVAVGAAPDSGAVPSAATVNVSFCDVNEVKQVDTGLAEPNTLPVVRPDFNDINLPANDDGSTGLVNIGFTINFYGKQYSSLYVNNNGNVTFDANMGFYTPFGLTGNIGTPIIAPFFADVDTRVGNLTTYGLGRVGDHNAFGVSWRGVGYFAEHTDKLNTFQMLIIDRSDRTAGDFDIEFDYDQIQWETGDASLGANGFGGSSAHAGFSNGTGNANTFYEFAGSGVPGALLDTNPTTGLIHNSRASDVPGRYIFTVEGGLPTQSLFGAQRFYVHPDSVLNGFEQIGDTNNWQPTAGSHNIDKDPCFIVEYLLSQIPAGQLITSPCVDAGSADANNSDINLAGYTTRTDSVPDANIVDMGYHYRLFSTPQYRLDFNVVEGNGLTQGNITPSSGLFNWFTIVPLHVNVTPPAGYQVLWTGSDNDDANGLNNIVMMDRNRTVTVAFVKNICDLTVQVIGIGGTLTVSPPNGPYQRGSVVTLTAHPDTGYRVQQWTGTDDDNSFLQTNTVTMNGDKYVTLEFGVPRTLTVPGNYTTIQAAVGAARQGDIVTISSGVYNTPNLVIDKEITVTSTNPDDPCVVAMTVIDGNGIASIGVYFGADTTPRTVFDGITIANTGYTRIAVGNATVAGAAGPDGLPAEGGGMIISGSPTIRNCVVRNCNIFGGNAGNGANASATVDGGHGGWGGWARGGGIIIYPFAEPNIINTTVTNCTVTGGNGGNGGSYSATGNRDAGNGGNWSDGTLWQVWGYIGDYRFYSGYGGGVYCDSNSSPTFISCNITNNRAIGGMSGIGGSRASGVQIPMPDTSYRIPSYGGGVYCAENSHVTFTDCNITGNTAPKPDTTYHSDPYLGHGGGVAFDKTSFIRFENCNITNNIAAVGGGMFWAGDTGNTVRPEIIDSTISGNIAYVGGGVYGTYSEGLLKNCTLYNNFAGIGPNDVDAIVGQGGAIFSAATRDDIEDCFLNQNVADASGGGLYIYGPGGDVIRIKNCLLTGNEAGRDGGGFSVNWGAIASIENCTLYGNLASATFGDPGRRGFGGGLYCSYGAITSVINSIFWNDDAVIGTEISVESGFEFDPHCGTVNVSYSDVEGGSTGVKVGTGCVLNWGAGNINVAPQFVSETVGNFRLKQKSSGQSVDSPCVDTGSTLSVYLGLILYSTSTIGSPDLGQVDMGYHYATYEPCTRADLFADNSDIINFRDLAILAQSWMEQGCSDAGGWCGGADLSFNGSVDIADVKVMADCWLEKLVSDTKAPTPNPMTWAILPHATSSTSVEMMATVAADESVVVEYEFNETTRPALNSGWRADPCYMVSGLDANGPYCFQVRARDKYGNTTGWSSTECLSQLGDVNAPGPAPTIVREADVNNISWADPNTLSGQFQYTLYPVDYRWWHRVIANVAGITDDQPGLIELRFICTNDGSLSSINKVKDANGDPAQIIITQPVAIGSRAAKWRVTYAGSTIVYDVDVEKVGGSGRKLFWKACVYDKALNENCSDVVEIVWPPIQ